MKKQLLAIGALAMALAVPLIVAAQDEESTPNPDPLDYNDPAMHYSAPPDAKLVGNMTQATLDQLGDDPTTIATWVVGAGHSDAKVISIMMESYTGDLDGWDSTYENALREQDSSADIKNKEHVQLQNGMPALFVEATLGSGFTTHKVFAYIWIDSQRGVVLSASAPLGGIDEDQAKELLAGATAVRYPTNQP